MSRPEQDVAHTNTRPTILVTDDAPEYLMLLGEILSPHYNVRIAGSGSGAVTTGDTSANFVAERQRIWSLGGNYTYGPATVGLVWRTLVLWLAMLFLLGIASILR
mgnify:CR=1 FL=1